MIAHTMAFATPVGLYKLPQIFFIEMRTYFSFGLIVRDIPNSITPQTTLRLLPIPVGLLVLPCTRQCRRSPPPPLPQQLALNMHVKH